MSTLTAPPTPRFTAMGPNEIAWVWLDLAAWLPAGDTPVSPMVAITPLPGDAAPLTVSVPATIDTGLRTFRLPSGLPYISAGPRIMAELKSTGATIGNDYAVVFTWTDSTGQTLSRTVMQNIANR